MGKQNNDSAQSSVNGYMQMISTKKATQTVQNADAEIDDVSEVDSVLYMYYLVVVCVILCRSEHLLKNNKKAIIFSTVHQTNRAIIWAIVYR